MSNFKVFREGSAVYLALETRDLNTPGEPLFNPDGGVKVTLYDADGVKVLDDVSMSNPSTGLWTYTYQTTVGAAKGVWRGYFKATHGTTVVITQDYTLFKLLAQ